MKFRIACLAAAALAAATPAAAQAPDGLNLIRDAEIEHIIRVYTTPIFQVSGLQANNVKVHLINDTRLNAFVAGGQHVFVNTGLLIRAEHAGQVIGVIAHETGHIVGGHLVRLQSELRAAQIRQIIALILSAGAGVAAKNPGVLVAGMGLGARITEGTFYQFTRTMESAADAHAMATLDRLQLSSRGLFEFLEILAQQEMIYPRYDPYLRTHPMARDRTEEVRRHLARSPYTDRPLPKQYEMMQTRLRAKLIGFLRPPNDVYQTYKGREGTVEARYALAVAYHIDARLDRALQAIDSLIKEQPSDPYFHELRGQILFESGRVREAVDAYERAAKLAPGEALIRVGLGQAQLETGDPRLERAAVANLQAASRQDDNYPLTWRLLAAAHGKMGDEGNSALASAEYAFLTQDLPMLRASLTRAERALKTGTPAWVRAQDLKAQAAQIREDRRR